MDQLANMGFDVSDVILCMQSNTIKWPSTAILQLIWTPPTMLQDIAGNSIKIKNYKYNIIENIIINKLN